MRRMTWQVGDIVEWDLRDPDAAVYSRRYGAGFWRIYRVREDPVDIESTTGKQVHGFFPHRFKRGNKFLYEVTRAIERVEQP